MATNKVVIDVEARFQDSVTDEAKAASKGVDDLGNAAEKAKKKVNDLGKQKARPRFDADDSKFLKKLRNSDNKLKKFAGEKATAILNAIDKASPIVGKVLGKIGNFAGKTWSGILKAKDMATSTMQKVTALGKTIGSKTWTALVKIKDMATTPLQKIKNSLFSIKSLVAAITAGLAAQQFVINPIGLADQYSSASIGFKTLLGEDQGQKMMDDLDQFAKETPFKSSEVIGQTQRMIAMGWEAEDIINDMTTIGDAAAATGKGEQGLQQIVTALAQIKSKGKLSTEELNQLAEAGISAKRYIAEGLGYGSGDEGIAKMTKDLEDGAISSGKALEALLSGMKEYEGMMEKTANETVQGLWSQIEDTFEINIFRRWGQGLQDGAKRGLGSIVSLLETADGALTTFGDTVYEVGKEISNWAADKLEKTVKTIQEIVGSNEFKNASIGGKIKLIWDGAIANPLADWWDQTVVPWWDATAVPWLAEKAAGIGKALGSGLTNGVAALLGLDASGALEDGVTIGGSFMEGFLEGFDTSKIWDALKSWASDNKGMATTLGVILGAKLLSGLGGMVGNIKGLFGGGGGGGIGDYSTATMTVNAGVVNINSGLGGGTPDLPGGTAGETAGKVGFFGRVKGFFGSTGNAMVGGSGLMGKLASAGYSLTGGAAGSTLSGGAAAAIGGGSILGGVLGAAGIGSGIKDIWQATKKKGKEAKDKYFSGGTKIAMVGTGALAGAKIGAAIGTAGGPIGTGAGALIGAGVGGAGALLGGGKIGKWLSDATDEGGALNNAWKATKGFFTDTIPEKWNEFCDGVSDYFTESIKPGIEAAGEAIGKFFTETVPEKWGEFWDGVGEFFTETIPEAWDSLTEKVSNFFTETIPEAWDSLWDLVGEVFLEKIPYAIGFVSRKIYDFFTETIPEAWNDFWGTLSTFFGETLPEWAGGIWNDHIVPFFTETVPEFFSGLWDSISTFFSETIPEWAGGIWNDHVLPFFTETVPGFFSRLWESISTFFTETLPEWAEGIWNDNIYPFFTETVPGFFSSLWESITTFFTETLPEWAGGIWNDDIKPFFTETIPGFFSSLWDSVTGFFNETLPSIGSTIWGSIKGFFTESIPNMAKQAWEKVKGSFSLGWGDGGGDGGGKKTKKARGGIIGGTSSMEAFARGGMVGGSTRFIRVNEEAPEMIIPLASQRRDRALKLWMKTGEMLGVDGFYRGGNTSRNHDEGLRFKQYGQDEPAGGQNVEINVGGITFEITVHANEGESIVEAIKAQAEEIAETVAGVLADAFGPQFENTPVRGGVA